MKKDDLIFKILIVLFIVLVIYVVFDQLKKPEIEYNPNETVAYIAYFGNCDTGYKLDFNDNIVKYDDLPESFINNTLYNYLKNKGKVFINNENESFTRDDLKDAVKHIYGNVNYEYKDIFSLGDFEFNYDSSINKYITKRDNDIKCTNIRSYGYLLDSITQKNHKYFIDVLYYEYDFEIKDGTCVRFNFYGTKDNEEFTYGKPDSLKYIPEHFLKYRFVFVEKKESYIFDHIELVD